MKFNIVEVFCEILSGLVLLILIIPILELSNSSNINEIWDKIIVNLTAPNVTLLIIFSYLIGLIADAIGFSIGEWFLDDLINKTNNTSAKRKSFYNNVSAHILSYRDSQWAYYSLYRNLFILFFLHGIVWSTCIIIHHEFYYAFILLAVLVLIETALFRTLKGISKLYVEITSDIEKTNAP